MSCRVGLETLGTAVTNRFQRGKTQNKTSQRKNALFQYVIRNSYVLIYIYVVYYARDPCSPFANGYLPRCSTAHWTSTDQTPD